MSSPLQPPGTALVRLHDLGKTFGATQALANVSFEIYPGEVVALLGANGAGKSTLVKILAGSLRADTGHISIGARPADFNSPIAARRAGIVTVHQRIDDGIVPGLSVAQNLLLDQLCHPGSKWWLGNDDALERARQIAAGIDLHLPLNVNVENLGLAQRQMLILARALALKPRLLILDEPTASLSYTEAQQLFAVVDRLCEQGVAVLYISHRLADLERLADRAIVLRDGRLAGEFDAPSHLAAAVEAMLGGALGEQTYQPGDVGERVLHLSDCRVTPESAALELTLHAGEVVALTGLLGAGKTEVAEVIAGLRRAFSATIELHGQPWSPRSVRHAISSGVFFAAEDRTSQSLIPGFSIRQTLTLPFLKRFSRAGFIRHGLEAVAVSEQMLRLGIKADHVDAEVDTLSGGNQQKVVLGRWLLGAGHVLILDEPFQGVDVRARREIGQRIRDGAQGRAILLICSDPDEALEVADRILVMRDGAIIASHCRTSVQRRVLLAQLAGLAPEADPPGNSHPPRSQALA